VEDVLIGGNKNNQWFPPKAQIAEHHHMVKKNWQLQVLDPLW